MRFLVPWLVCYLLCPLVASAQHLVRPGDPECRQLDECPTGSARNSFGCCVALAVPLADPPPTTAPPSSSPAERPAARRPPSCRAGDGPSCTRAARRALEAAIPNFAALRRELSEGCAHGAFRACTTLGWLIENGLGGAANHDEAVRLYGRACDHHDAPGCANLATTLESADPPRAERLYRDVCGAGIASACTSLGTFLARRPDGRVEAETVLDMACDGGDQLACTNLAVIIQDRARPRAQLLLDHACAAGFPHACYVRGALAHNAALDTEAATFFERGCALGGQTSCFQLALRLERGTGVSADATRAQRLYQDACAAHVDEACRHAATR